MKATSSLKAKRQNLRLSFPSILSRNSPTFPISKQNFDIPTSESQKGELQTPKLKKKLQRKKSLNIDLLPKSFEMFQCGEIEINSEFEAFYEIVGKIDEGTQSVVYKCKQRETGNIFVAKAIRSREQDLIQTIKKQFLILKHLTHDNILRSYKLFVDAKRGICHLITDFCPYENLKLYLVKNRVLPEAKVAHIASTILHVLEYLHKRGICHRDIKPDNILYDPKSGDLKLIDFQICKMTNYEHQQFDMWSKTGTLFYKAPEMFLGGYNQKVDLWALGVTCFELLTGRVPFFSLFEKQTKELIKNGQINFQELKLTQRCSSFLKKCLVRDPNIRISAKQALQAPFLLAFSSSSINAMNPSHKRNASLSPQVSHEQVQNAHYHEDVSQLLNREILIKDTGIRIITDFN